MSARYLAGALSFSLVGLCACSVKLVSVDDDEGGDEAASTDTGSDDEVTADTGSSTTTDTTTTTTTTTDDSTETDTDEGISFVPDEDFFTGCSQALSQCDHFAQDCPETEKCVPYWVEGCGSWNKCTPPGEVPLGEACTVTDDHVDDCDPSGFCYPGQFELEGPATCVGFCGGTYDDPICPEGLTCAFDLLLYQGGFGCLPICDPLAPDCGPGLMCARASDMQPDFACIPAAAELANAGEACNRNQRCASGLCVEAALVPDCAGEACCAELCDLQAPDCLDPTMCAPVQDELPDSPVGACLLP